MIQEVSIFREKHEFLPEELTTTLISYPNSTMNEVLYKKLTRTAGRNSKTKEIFVEMMDDLFYITYSYSFGQRKINVEKKKFLMPQDQKEKPGLHS